MLEGAYSKAAMKKTQVENWHKRFRFGCASVLTNHTPGERQLRQMTKILSACAMMSEATGDSVFRRYQRK
jgi:hypothetical protein